MKLPFKLILPAAGLWLALACQPPEVPPPVYKTVETPLSKTPPPAAVATPTGLVPGLKQPETPDSFLRATLEATVPASAFPTPSAAPSPPPIATPAPLLSPTITASRANPPQPGRTRVTGLGGLYWGADPVSKQQWTVETILSKMKTSSRDEISRTTNRIMDRARETRGQEVPPVAELNLEGLVFNDPRHVASSNAIKSFPALYAWAFASRVMPAAEAAPFRNKALSTSYGWVETYVPNGNPINENSLIPLLLAIDLMYDSFAPAQKAKVDIWLMELVSQGDTHFNTLSKNSPLLINNWNSWRLAIRGMVSRIVNDTGLLATSRELIAGHLRKNLVSDGSCYDFRERDALHYHTYNLQALVWLELFASDLVSPEGKAAILKSLEFIKPYLTGEKTHIEFANSRIGFDVVRREAGDPDFAQTAWKPEKARILLRLANAPFPEIRSWTAQVEDENYDPMIKHIAALHRVSSP